MVTSNPGDANTSKEEKAAKTLSLIVISFLICWLPMTTCFYVFAIGRDRNFNESVLDLCIVLSHFNSVIDPLIYACRIKDVKAAVKTFMRCRRNDSSLKNSQNDSNLSPIASKSNSRATDSSS